MYKTEKDLEPIQPGQLGNGMIIFICERTAMEETQREKQSWKTPVSGIPVWTEQRAKIRERKSWNDPLEQKWQDEKLSSRGSIGVQGNTQSCLRVLS